MNILKKYFWMLAVLCCAVSVSAENKIGSERLKRILFVDSYASSDIWTSDMKNAFENCLEQKSILAVYETFELAVRSKPGVVPAAADVKALKEKLQKQRYDLIVVSNNDAANLFLNGTVSAIGKTPILITSYAGKLSEKIVPDSNITGIETKINMPESFSFGMNLIPVEKFVIIAEASADDEALKHAITKLPANVRTRTTLLSGREYTTSELLKKVSKLPKNALIFFHSWSSSKDHMLENSYTILPRLRSVFSGMILGKYDSYIRFGALGGPVIRGLEQGNLAGDMAARLLNGESASSLPVRKGSAHAIMDYPSALKSGIDFSNLPSGTRLINKPSNFIAKHQIQFAYGAALLLLLLLLYILKLRYRREIDAKMSVLFPNLPLRVIVVDQSGHILYLHVADGSNYKCLQNIKNIKEMPDYLRDFFAGCVKKTFETQCRLESEYEVESEIRHISFIPLPEKNPFKRPVVMGCSRDITELRNAHLAAEQIADRFRLTLESIGDGVVVTDAQGVVTLINPVAEMLTGYKRDEAVGKKLEGIFNIVSYIDGKTVDSPLKKALEADSTVELTNHTDLISKDGSRRHIADCASPVHAADGSITGGVLVFRDVTEEYEKRDDLRLSSLVLKNASEIAKFIYFRMKGKEFVFISDRDSGFWKFRNGQPVPAAEWVAPEYLSGFGEGFRKIFNGEISVWNFVYAVDLNGHRQYFEIRMEESLGEANTQRELCGIVQDITQSRESEMHSRDNLKMLETIINNLPGYLFVKDVSNQFRYLISNTSFETLVGVPKEKIVGSFDSEIFPLDADAAAKFRKDDMDLVDSGKPLDIQEIFTNSNGATLIVRTIKNVIMQSDGRQLLIGMGIDISRQYHLEQEQKRTIEMLNSYIENERIINLSLSRITLETDFDRAINDILKIIGENAGVDRCYMFRYTNADLSRSDNDYEWVRDGIEPEIDNLQNVDMTAIPGWKRTLAAHRDIIIPDIANPPADLIPEAEFLSRQNIKSLLVCGIWLNESLYGYVGFDFVRNQKDFKDSDIHVLHCIVNLFLLAKERQEQINRIADSVSLQRQIVDNISIPITMLAPDYTIIAANPKACEESGTCSDELAGKKCYDIFCRNGKPLESCPVRDTLRDFRIHSQEWEIDGCEIISTAQPIFDRQGKLVYVLLSDIDITEQTRQKRQIQVAMEQAQAADRAKSYFLATVSHELRTPLNAVIGFSELLQHKNVEPALHDEYLASINLAGNALLNLINDVLDLSKLEAEQMTIVAAKTNIVSLVDEIVSVFKLKAEQKHLELQAECADLPYLYLDQLRLRQVIFNLVGNAVKFTDAGFVCLKAEFEYSGDDRTGTLILKVSDSGIGIRPENVKKIFEPFVQEYSIRGNRVYEGSGLGLAITQRLIARMNGTLSLSTTPGKGSEFTIRLPKVEYERMTGEMIPAAEETGEEVRTLSGRVLLIDDVPMNLKVLQAMLKKMNVESVLTDSAGEALKLLENDTGFDFILTDLWMPEINGSEFVKRLVDIPAAAHIPVIAVTADTQIAPEIAELFFDILLKPITIESLTKIIAGARDKNKD